MRAWLRAPSVDAVLVGPVPDGALLPEECACCGAAASHRRALPRPARAALLVGYCDECARHLSASATLKLASGLASLLLALCAAAALPLLWPSLGRFGSLLAVGALSLLPAALLLFARTTPQAPHASRGLAVRGARDGSLVCASARYGRLLAELNALAVSPLRVRESRWSAWQSAGPLLGAGAALLFHAIHHPSLRIVNLSESRLDVLLDGERVASVEPTSQESPAAGVVVHVAAGHHRLTTLAPDGSAPRSIDVDFEPLRVHLFAPGSEGSCFWLETLGYGRERRAAPAYQALKGEDRFWVLPDGIDLWFSPALAAESPSFGSSGGLITALRQAPCDQAPLREAD